MNVLFRIHYFTHPGQQVVISGNIEATGRFDEQKALPMKPTNDGFWELWLTLEDGVDLEYRYLIRRENNTERREFGNCHKVRFQGKIKECFLMDAWQAEPNWPFLYSSAFTDSLLKTEACQTAIEYASGRVVLKVHAPFVRKNQCLGISGDNALFGAWKTDRVLRMHPGTFPEWEISMDANALPVSSNYKFVLLEKEHGKMLHYEWGEPRNLTVPQHMHHQLLVYSGMTFRFQEAPWKGAGVAIPVFSLRSEKSWGCGDFGDLKKMVKWASATGLQMVQILPINDTTQTETWLDSYPYNAISCFSLHPIYCNINALPPLNDLSKMEDLEIERTALNALPQLDYEGVLRLKWKYFKALFLQEGKELLESESFKAFFEQNRSWLVPYSAYCYLRWKTGKSDFRDWGLWANYATAQIEDLTHPTQAWYPEIAIHYIIQYYLDRQLREVTAFAHAHSVVLKGDIPIGVSRTSVETWSESALFNCEVQVGAPPDEFSVTGQNWGFPSYRWEEHEKTQFDWWKRRFHKMADYFDAYRIDHILGFFRIWEIPAHAIDGLLGHFNPAMPLHLTEMEHWGFQFEEESMTRPFLTEGLLHFKFGKKAAEVQKKYLRKTKDGLFELKKEYSTQRLIKDSFGDSVFAPEQQQFVEKLFALCSEVLFVRDTTNPEKFHPRISAFGTERFRTLTDVQKQRFSNLYNDYFFVRNIDFWKRKALEKLTPLIGATRMLVCGEDLGMIPSCVPEVMHQLGILSLEIQRMPKKFGVMYDNLNAMPYESVLTTSTHDMSPPRVWWLEDRERTQQYYNQILWKPGDAPWECTPEIAQLIVRNHMFAPAMWVVLPLQDILATDCKFRNPDPLSERINVPSNPRNYWRYRMHVTLESLLEASVFNAKIREMIVQSGR